MAARIRLMPVSVDISRRALGPYAPVELDLARALDALVRTTSQETVPHLVSDGTVDGTDLELRTIFSRLEPDTQDHPFASVLVVIEVLRVATGQPVYTRQVESEVRRLIQLPAPLDDARFARTALGRATVSCLRSLFTALGNTFATP